MMVQINENGDDLEDNYHDGNITTVELTVFIMTKLTDCLFDKINYDDKFRRKR